MLSLSVDNFLTRILPRRPSTAVSTSRSRTVGHPTDGLSCQKQIIASSDVTKSEPRKRVAEQSREVSMPAPYPYSHRPRPFYRTTSSSFSTTLSIETSGTVPTPKTDIGLPDLSVISPIKWRKYFSPNDQSDVIIRGKGHNPVDFYVDSQTIFMASPTLQLYTVHYGILCLDGRTKRAILTLDEPSSAIDSLLRLAYPQASKPEVSSTEILCDLLALCQRYNMAQATHYLCSSSLRDLARVQPLDAYGIACRFNLESEIPFISRETLRVNLSKVDLGRDLGYCTPQQVEKLLKLHKRRGKEAIKLVGELSTEGLTCGGEYCEDGVAEWWLEVVKASRYLLLRKPTAEVLFSPEVLAGCCRRASLRCSLCPISFLSSRSQHWLAIVKAQVDSLPCSL